MKMSSGFCRILVSLLACCALIAMTGCTTIVEVPNMISEGIVTPKKEFDGTIQVVVDTTKANDHFRNWVVDAPLKSAIEQSLLKARLFTAVSPNAVAAYQLRVSVTSVGQFWGGTFGVAVNTTWELTDLRRQALVWKDVVQGKSSATGSDAFSGMTRAKIAYERAIKENIRNGIGQLSSSV